jgi:uncharacterized protein with HEPN domain
MRSEKLYLLDMTEAVHDVIAFMQDATAEQFCADELMRSAVAVKLRNIAEACECVSEDLRQRHNEIDWAEVIALGRGVLERYWDVDWNAVWRWATLDASLFGELVACILRSEFGMGDQQLQTDGG